MSPPTYAPSAGNTDRTGARVQGQSEVGGEDVGGLRGGHHERRDPERLGVDAEGQCGHRRVARERDLVDVRGVDAGLAQTSRGQLVPASRAPASRNRSSARGSSIVALIRVITSPPNGCCLFSLEATATGVPVRGRAAWRRRSWCRGRRRSRSAAGRVAGLDVDQRLVDDDRGHLEARLRAAPSAAGAARAGPASSSRSSIASSSRVEVGALVGERGLGRARRTASGRRAAGSPAARRRPSPPWAAWSAAAPRPRGRGSPAPGRPAASPRRAGRGEGAYVVPGDRGVRPVDAAPCTCGRCRDRRRWSRSRCRSTTPSRRR